MTGATKPAALVTGSTRGIGRAIARRLARDGARVVVHGRSAPIVDRAVADVGAVGGVVGDMSDPGGARLVCAEAADRLGHVDILVNNAGGSEPADFLQTADEVWEHLFALNFYGPMTAIRAVLPGMRERGWGRILNVVSVAAVEGTPGFSAYASSKGALLSLTRTLAAEVKGSGVRINALAPLALTDMVRSQLSQRHLEALTARGFPTVDDCAAEAMTLLNRDAPSGHLKVMDFSIRPVSRDPTGESAEVAQKVESTVARPPGSA